MSSTLSFGWLKVIYPYPNFMPPDSYSYLEAAYSNEFINMWAIGYSKFLRLVSIFSASHFVLVIIQYFLLQVTIVYFLFSIRYLFAPGKWLFILLFALTVLNPLVPHISNFVSSDCLFTALSLLWFTQLLWIINHPTQKLLLFHAVVLLLAFSVRYNALYYPLISLSIIFARKMPRQIKYWGATTILTFILAFIGCTQYEYHKKTDTVQYSAFGGWQIAANALYGYAHSDLHNIKNVPKELRPLHEIVNKHMDSIRHLTVRPDEEVGVYYLWDFKSPLRIYMDTIWLGDTVTPFFKKWASMAPAYAAYGRYIIWEHPLLFLKYYAWPNFRRYFAPPAQFMGAYNLGNETVDPIAVKWFKWSNNKLSVNTSNKQIKITEFFTVLTAIVNIIFVASFFVFVFLGGYQRCNSVNRLIMKCIFAIWFFNMVFSVLAAPIELRYQLFPFLTTLVMAYMFMGYIIQESQLTEKKKRRIASSLTEEVAI